MWEGKEVRKEEEKEKDFFKREGGGEENGQDNDGVVSEDNCNDYAILRGDTW